MSGTGRRRKPPVGEEGNEQYAAPPAEQPPSEQQYQAFTPLQQPQYEQYQTYAPPQEQQYDYDWRQQSQMPPAPQAPAPSVPQPAPSPSPAPVSSYQQPAEPPQYNQYAQYDQYQQQSGSGSGYSYGGQVPSQQRWDQSAAPAAPPAAPVSPPPTAAPPISPAAPTPFAAVPAQAEAPAAERPRVTSRPEPRPEPHPEPRPNTEFEFEFDLDLDEPSTPAVQEPPVFQESPASPAPTTPAARRPADRDGYRPEDFDFVEQADEPDVKDWLTFSETRADSRAERMRKMRVRLLAAGIALVLVAAGVGVYVWLGGNVPGVSTQNQATKSLILFRLDDTKGDSVGDALMVTNRSGSTDGTASGTGAIVVIPAQMQIDDQGFGAQPFGGNMASEQPPAGSAEVADALGVTPDGVWTMDETTFGILVTYLDGLSLTTNTAVPASSADPTGVPAGTTTLTGVQAVAYATYQASGEPASAQAARFAQVLTALMNKMPTYSVSVNAYLNQLGLITDPALPVSKLGPFLASLAAQQAAGLMTVATLPLTSDGSNSLNYTGATQIVSKLLGGTLKAGASAGQSARVLVQNGTGVASGGSSGGKLLASAQAKLEDAGYTYNAGNTVATQAHTEVEIASSSNQGLAEEVAASLGLSGSTVQVVSGVSTVDDVTVVLGQDWSSLSAQ